MSDASVIFQVWGDHHGYVSLPRKLRDSSSVKGPKNNGGSWQEGPMFQWPEDKAKIAEWVRDSYRNKYDLYWCPCVFDQPKRRKENIGTMDTLYADLDEVNPSSLPKHLRPTVAWESSPGRYAAVWKLSESHSPQDAERWNKKLTYFIGADKGGWDLTQVLRVPGLPNYKYEGAPKGKLLWNEGTHIQIKTLEDMPDLAVSDMQELSHEEVTLPDTSSLPQLVRPFLQQISKKTLDLLFTGEEDTLLSDRSEKLWELECKLLEEGVPKDDVVKLIAACAWNKYRGRRDETRRILTEVEKAAASVDVVLPTQVKNMEKVWTPYDALMGMQLKDPGWMIEGVWQKNSHGMIAGEPKTYKSMLVTDMAVSVASGTPFLGKYPVHNSGPVLYIQEENSAWLVQDRVSKIAYNRGLLNGKVKVNPPNFLNIQFPPILPIHFLNNQGFDLTNTDDRLFLEEAIRKVKPVFIIFDSLYLMLGGKDENSSKDLRPVLSWLLQIRYQYNTAVALLHHWNKNGKSERGGQRMLGSVLFHAWVESAMYTQLLDEEHHQVAVEREFRSFTKPGKLEVTFHMGEPGDLRYDPKVGTMSEEVSQSDLVYDLICASNAVSAEEVGSALKLKKRELTSRLDGLVKSGKVVCINGIYRPNRKELTNEQSKEDLS